MGNPRRGTPFRAFEGDDSRRVYIQAAGHPIMDAALLLIPKVGFVAYDDPRMLRTVQAVRDDLEEGGLLRSYAAGEDGLDGHEGVFLPGSFWLAECLAHQNRGDAAARSKPLTTAMPKRLRSTGMP